MNTYKVKKIECSDASRKDIWDSIPKIKVDNFVWDENGYKPQVEAAMFYTDTHFHLYFKAYEDEITAVYTELNDPVCRDSCMEFFFKPVPDKDDRYLNFEMNPIGTLLLGLGKDRYGRTRPCNSADVFNVKTSVSRSELQAYKDSFWTISYSIPFTFLEGIYGKLDFKSGSRLEANFYKCGDESKYKHFGSWNRIELPKPDFHRPEFFGELILE